LLANVRFRKTRTLATRRNIVSLSYQQRAIDAV
jgi:hypothetical protein